MKDYGFRFLYMLAYLLALSLAFTASRVIMIFLPFFIGAGVSYLFHHNWLLSRNISLLCIPTAIFLIPTSTYITQYMIHDGTGNESLFQGALMGAGLGYLLTIIFVIIFGIYLG